MSHEAGVGVRAGAAVVAVRGADRGDAAALTFFVVPFVVPFVVTFVVTIRSTWRRSQNTG